MEKFIVSMETSGLKKKGNAHKSKKIKRGTNAKRTDKVKVEHPKKQKKEWGK